MLDIEAKIDSHPIRAYTTDIRYTARYLSDHIAKNVGADIYDIWEAEMRTTLLFHTRSSWWWW